MELFTKLLEVLISYDNESAAWHGVTYVSINNHTVFSYTSSVLAFRLEGTAQPEGFL